MSTWNELLHEVEEKGRDKASAIARLAWACETGNGVDQHAAEDIKEVAAQLTELKEWLSNRGDRLIALINVIKTLREENSKLWNRWNTSEQERRGDIDVNLTIKQLRAENEYLKSSNAAGFAWKERAETAQKEGFRLTQKLAQAQVDLERRTELYETAVKRMDEALELLETAQNCNDSLHGWRKNSIFDRKISTLLEQTK